MSLDIFLNRDFILQQVPVERLKLFRFVESTPKHILVYLELLCKVRRLEREGHRRWRWPLETLAVKRKSLCIESAPSRSGRNSRRMEACLVGISTKLLAVYISVSSIRSSKPFSSPFLLKTPVIFQL